MYAAMIAKTPLWHRKHNKTEQLRQIFKED